MTKRKPERSRADRDSAPITPIDGIDVYVDGNINIPGIRPRAHTRKGRPLGNACSWLEACATADEILTMFGNREKDRGIWVWYTTYLGVDFMMDLAFRVMSEYRQGEIKWPVRAFQKHLQDMLPKGGAK